MTKCIIHIDMDCFYAQVEAVRLGVDCRSVPFILAQWGNLIAVNYPARAAGVERFATVREAREKCPEVQVAFVPTYRVGESCYQYHANAHRNTHKVALEPYREASRKIFSILHSFPKLQVEKASVDEAFVDATEAAQEELERIRQQYPEGYRLDPIKDVMDEATKLIPDRSEELEFYLAEQGTSLQEVYNTPMQILKRSKNPHKEPGSYSFHIDAGATPREKEEYYENCLLLAAASRVVQRVREKIYEDLKYDCSAGIAHNRLLAKCISAVHKPRQQTLLFPDRVPSALFDIKLEKLRGFGGKFGRAVARVTGASVPCREAWLVPLESFYQLDAMARERGEEEEEEGETSTTVKSNKRPRQSFTVSASRASEAVNPYDDWARHETSLYTFFRIRGLGTETVKNRVLVKSLMATKTFISNKEGADWELVEKWLVVLSTELSARYQEFVATNHTKGRNVVLKMESDSNFTFHKTIPLPDPATQEALYNVTAHEAQRALRQHSLTFGQPAMVNTVLVVIGNLTGQGGSMTGQHTLTDMFAKKGETKVKEEGTSSSGVYEVFSVPSSESLMDDVQGEVTVVKEEGKEEESLLSTEEKCDKKGEGLSVLDHLARASARKALEHTVELVDESPEVVVIDDNE